MTTDLATFNPFDPAAIQCPFPHYAQMREEAPVTLVESVGMYLVTNHELVMQVLRDPATYSSLFGGASMPLPSDARAKMAEVMADGYPRVPTMLTADMPEHTRYRRLVSKAFTPKVVAELEPVIRSITTRLIDSWIDSGRIEFVEQFGVPLPVEVIAHALNVPDSRLADFKRWSDDSIAGIGTDISLEQRLEAERGVNEFQHYFAAELERRRTEPQDDLLTALLNARVDDDDPEVTDKRPLDVPEMLSIIQQLLVAGNETTTKLLTETMRLLAENPDEWTRLKQDPTQGSADRRGGAAAVDADAGHVPHLDHGSRTRRRAHPEGSADRHRVRVGEPRRVAVSRSRRIRPRSRQPARSPRVRQGHPLLPRSGAVATRGQGGARRARGPARELLAARDQRVPVLPELPAPRTHPTRRRRRPGGCSLMAGALAGKIAVVTGSSRGIGRGTAIALGEQGATVYVTGRSTGDGELTIDRTAALVDEAGGHGIAVQTDHGDDDQIAALFERVRAEQGKLDILVNNVYKIPDPPAWGGGFWDHPISIWDDQVGIGLRAHYVASWYAAPLLFAAGPGGFICNISSPGGQSYHFSSSYGAGKAGLDRLGADMAIELEPKGIAVVTVYPGTVSTEFIVEWSGQRDTDMDGAQTPLVVGRSVAALATAPDLMERSGSIQWVEDLGEEFGLVDEHGRSPAKYARRQ